MDTKDLNNNYIEAVEIIKTAILRSQYQASKKVNAEQLALYFGIGQYISANSRDGYWGTGALSVISERLQKSMPGLRGFSEANMRKMRIFYEKWALLLDKPFVATNEFDRIVCRGFPECPFYPSLSHLVSGKGPGRVVFLYQTLLADALFD